MLCMLQFKFLVGVERLPDHLQRFFQAGERLLLLAERLMRKTRRANKRVALLHRTLKERHDTSQRLRQELLRLQHRLPPGARSGAAG